MSTHQSSQGVDAVDRLRRGIDKLTEEHTQALEQATHVKMTPEEAREWDTRRTRITELVEQLLEVISKAE